MLRFPTLVKSALRGMFTLFQVIKRYAIDWLSSNDNKKADGYATLHSIRFICFDKAELKKARSFLKYIFNCY